MALKLTETWTKDGETKTSEVLFTNKSHIRSVMSKVLKQYKKLTGHSLDLELMTLLKGEPIKMTVGGQETTIQVKTV